MTEFKWPLGDRNQTEYPDWVFKIEEIVDSTTPASKYLLFKVLFKGIGILQEGALILLKVGYTYILLLLVQHG